MIKAKLPHTLHTFSSLFLLFCLLYLVPDALHAQENEYLKNSRWINGYYEVEPVGSMFWPVLKSTTKFITEEQDTILDSLSYIVLFRYDSIGSKEYYGGLRIDSGRWFFFQRDSLQEKLLYDFNLSEGDTVKEKDFYRAGPYYYYPSGDLIVNQIDTQIFNGIPRRQLHFRNASGSWIEGIGNTQGFLWHPYPNISAYVNALDCYSKVDTTHYTSSKYYTNNFNEACQLSFSLSPLSTAGINIYPNPTNDLLHLNLPPEYGSSILHIYSLSGKLLQKRDLHSGDNFFQHSLTSGVYFFKIKKWNGEWVEVKRVLVR